MKTVSKEFLVVFVFFLVFFVTFVLAAHTVTLPNGSTSVNVNEDVGNFYNVTVNNTDTGQDANITQINITLPPSFTFVNSSNGTDAFGTLIISGQVLSWSNTSAYLINGSAWKNFWINATATTPGNFNISVASTNSAGTFYSNISVSVNDTTAPGTVEFVNLTNISGSVLPTSYINFNVSANDSGLGLSNITVYLYNSTHDRINSSNYSSSLFSGRFIQLPNAIYYINASARDTSNNINWTSDTRNFTVNDTTAPTVSISASSNLTAIVVSIKITGEDYSGVQTCSVNTGDSVSGSIDSWSFTDNGLSCGETYTYNVTCRDWAGLNSSDTDSFTTSACGTSSSSSSSSSSDVDWVTIVKDEESFDVLKTYEKALNLKQRVKIKFGNDTHYVGVKTLSENSVTIVVESTPQEAVISEGESKKFDVTSDGYYDLLVSIKNVTSTYANVQMDYLHEEVPIAVSNDTETNATGGGNETEGNENIESSSSGGLWGWVFWVIIIVVVCVLIVAAAWYYKNKTGLFSKT